MEKDFTRDSFERLLKEKSDEFRMYPSNRVWNSIYNNFHPSRKWPSVVMCITLITALLMVGYLNTNTTHQTRTAAVAKSESGSAQQLYVADVAGIKPVIFNNTVTPEPAKINTATASKASSGKSNKYALIDNNNYKPSIAVANTISAKTIQLPVIKDHEALANTWNNDIEKSSAAVIETVAKNNEASPILSSTDNKAQETAISYTTTNDQFATGNYIEQGSSIAAITMTDNPVSSNSIIENTKEHFTQKLQLLSASTQDDKAIAATQAENNRLLQEQKSWIENYALYNRPAAKKWKGKLAWQGYFTPSVVYRKLYSNVNENHAAQFGFTSRAFYTDVNGDVVQKPSYGFEAGAGLKYNLFKWAKIKTGLQVNYTRYSIQAYKNSHPASTTLTMVDEKTGLPYEVFRSTSYSNIYGLAATKLHNQTVQLSIPIGLDFRIGGYDNFEWYAGAAIQPTLLLGGSNYLISSDRQNYIGEKSMISRLNMNAAFETYFTYKTSNGYTWEMGPQFRTQLFSTNSKYYSVGEKLVSYGFKIGISKKL